MKAELKNLVQFRKSVNKSLKQIETNREKGSKLWQTLKYLWISVLHKNCQQLSSYQLFVIDGRVVRADGTADAWGLSRGRARVTRTAGTTRRPLIVGKRLKTDSDLLQSLLSGRAGGRLTRLLNTITRTTGRRTRRTAIVLDVLYAIQMRRRMIVTIDPICGQLLNTCWVYDWIGRWLQVMYTIGDNWVRSSSTTTAADSAGGCRQTNYLNICSNKRLKQWINLNNCRQKPKECNKTLIKQLKQIFWQLITKIVWKLFFY